MTRPRTAVAAVVGVVATLVAACGCGSTGAAGGGSSSGAINGTVTVFAAASLTGTFTELGDRFERAHPGTDVVFSFGPSSGLAAQIRGGAPADVFAAASPQPMDQVVQAGLARDPVVFARNAMQVAVPARNPAGITQLADLARRDVKVALCQAAVPCGKAATAVLANADLSVTPVTQEVDVKAVMSKVVLGEVDAGLVYVTDVQAAGRSVKGIAVPPDVNATTAYPVVALSGSQNRRAATAFAEHVASAEAATVLSRAGFARP